MAPEAESILCGIYRAAKGLNEQAANQWLKNLQSDGLYAMDIWVRY